MLEIPEWTEQTSGHVARLSGASCESGSDEQTSSQEPLSCQASLGQGHGVTGLRGLPLTPQWGAGPHQVTPSPVLCSSPQASPKPLGGGPMPRSLMGAVGDAFGPPQPLPGGFRALPGGPSFQEGPLSIPPRGVAAAGGSQQPLQGLCAPCPAPIGHSPSCWPAPAPWKPLPFEPASTAPPPLQAPGARMQPLSPGGSVLHCGCLAQGGLALWASC